MKPNLFAAYCRHLAHQEARSLRVLYREHGRHVPVSTLVINLDDYERWKLERKWARLRARRKAG